MLHRLIFEDFYNIKLDEEFPDGVVIHHEDKNKLNNNMWNLIPMTNSDHWMIHHKGNSLSDETKKKLSESHSGEKNYWYGKKLSKEHRKNLSQSHLGITPSEETRQKMSKSQTGKMHSLGSKLKMSENRNKTGFFNVFKLTNESCRQGFTWAYYYYENNRRRMLSSVSLKTLKKKVLKNELEWIIIDMQKAIETCNSHGYDFKEII